MKALADSSRDQILHATRKLLSQQDFREITTKAIAKEAGVSEPTIFRHFPRKEEILGEILKNQASRFFHEVEAILQLVDSPREKLVAVCRRRASWAAENRDLFSIIQRECSYLAQRDSSLMEGVRRILHELEKVIRQGKERSQFRADAREDVTAMMFLSIIPSLFMEDKIRGPGPMSSEEFVERAEVYLQSYLRGVLADPKET